MIANAFERSIKNESPVSDTRNDEQHSDAAEQAVAAAAARHAPLHERLVCAADREDVSIVGRETRAHHVARVRLGAGERVARTADRAAVQSQHSLVVARAN